MPVCHVCKELYRKREGIQTTTNFYCHECWNALWAIKKKIDGIMIKNGYTEVKR